MRCNFPSYLRPLVLAVLFVGTTVAHAEEGEEWEYTAKYEVPGGAMAMPPMKNRACVQKSNAATPVLDPSCKVSDVKVMGNKTMFKMVCDGQGHSEFVGESTLKGDTVETAMRMKIDGQEMSMVTIGHRLGSCKLPETR